MTENEQAEEAWRTAMAMPVQAAKMAIGPTILSVFAMKGAVP